MIRGIVTAEPEGMVQADSAIISLSARADSARAARRFVRRVLHEWRCEHLCETSELLTSEIVTNALLHAGGAVELAVRRAREQVIRVEVVDSSPSPPLVAVRSRQSTTGRGLLLVEELAARWGVAAGPDGEPGKTVWFEVAS